VFFFQAEDGIRDLTVTGVQTCALPISARSCRKPRRGRRATPRPARLPAACILRRARGPAAGNDRPVRLRHTAPLAPARRRGRTRSEERRVGEERQWRWEAEPRHGYGDV